MATGIELVLGGVSFQSKEAVKREARRMLKTLGTLEGTDAEIIADLLKLHPQSAEKIGCGIKRLFVGQPLPSQPYNHCFYVERLDGTTQKFSYKSCLEAGQSGAKKQVLEAMRALIVKQVLAYKHDCFYDIDTGLPEEQIWSEIDQRWLREDECHVDHYPVPFADIAEEFMRSRWESWDNAPEVVGDWAAGTLRFAIPAVSEDWQIFHEARAEYRLISGTLNIKLGRHAA